MAHVLDRPIQPAPDVVRLFVKPQDIAEVRYATAAFDNPLGSSPAESISSSSARVFSSTDAA
jgi:hypothetical protein